MQAKRSKRAAAALALGASVLGGGAVGAAFMVPTGAGAQDTTTTAPTTDESTVGDTNGSVRRGAAQWLTEALDQLVTDGTLNQTQRDAVEAALEAAKPQRGPGGHDGPGRRGGPGLDAAATALSMTQDELRTALQGGATLVQVAESKGVDVQVVIDAIVAEMNTHIDEHLAAGDITQAQADARKAEATQRATDLANGVRPNGAPMGERGGRGPRGGPTADSTTTTEG